MARGEGDANGQKKMKKVMCACHIKKGEKAAEGGDDISITLDLRGMQEERDFQKLSIQMARTFSFTKQERARGGFHVNLFRGR